MPEDDIWDEHAWEAFLRNDDERVNRSSGHPISFEEGDEDDDAPTLDDLLALPVYQHAYKLANRVLAWSDGIPGDQKDSTFVHFCANTLQIPANIARGHGLGMDRDHIGGYIACTKRALQCANAALELLPGLRSAPYMATPAYNVLYERVFELRNEVGLYVQELRGRFELGID
ncbi:MAG: hypothetical protein SH809_02415 [Rhodothermales bacterium]|nr:hypothetical protein [Rhodothermales bacterium]